jgi:hypothetical protein
MLQNAWTVRSSVLWIYTRLPFISCMFTSGAATPEKCSSASITYERGRQVQLLCAGLCLVGDNLFLCWAAKPKQAGFFVDICRKCRSLLFYQRILPVKEKLGVVLDFQSRSSYPG